YRSLPAADSSHTSEQPRGPLRSPWRERITWVTLAFVPSSLLLGLTTYMTMDVAAIPLLWVLPLAAYLLTFVIAFAHTPLLRHEQMVRLQPLLVVPLAVIMFWGHFIATHAFLSFHLIEFFVHVIFFYVWF